MKQRFVILFLLFFFLSIPAVFSQQIEIMADDVPLNTIFIGLRDKYNLQFSFNDQLLSQYNRSITRKFPTPEAAIKALIDGFPLTFRKQGDTFMILPDNKQAIRRNYLLYGQIAESK